MNKVAGDLSFLGFRGTHSMHCLSCCCHLRYVFLYHMRLFSLLFSRIRMWNKAVHWIRPGPFPCLATEWHLFSRFFFFFFPPCSWEPAIITSIKDPEHSQGGKKGAKHSYSTCQEVCLLLYFYQRFSSRSCIGVKSSVKVFMNIHESIKLTKVNHFFVKSLP